MKRREFLGSALGSSVLLLTGCRTFAPQSKLADARIDVLLNASIGTIAAEIYGRRPNFWLGHIYKPY